ncbi:sugar ABC transporter substrate-binding protein [Actinomycetaceae bacterium MB13-C1-2]|nr:sugar ABC transporter substrate-binding protein [Actinomycetaceae bacterium MB13-C1-2]
MKHKPLTATISAVVLGLSLSACGSSAESTAKDQSDSPTAESSDEVVTLTFQSLSDQPAAIAATEEIVGAWNSANPDVQVKIVPAGWDGIYDKLITQFNGGAAPDIIHYEAASIVPFARDGYLADLSPYMSEEKKADIPEGVLKTVTVDDQIIAYPTEIQTYVAFANRGMLEKAGIEVPAGDTLSWDELRDIAAKVSDGTSYGIGWGLKSPTATFMAMAPGFGGTFFEGTGVDATIRVEDPELALPKLVDAMAHEDNSILPVTLTQSGSEALATFYAGQVAMTIQGSYQAANMAVDAPDDIDWVVLPPLAGPDGPAQAANPQTLSVSIDSKHIEESAAFIDFFTDAQNLVKINQADALIPATNSARELMSEELGDENGWDIILESGKYVTDAPYLFVDQYPQWKDTIATPAFQRFLAQENDAAALAEQLVSGWNSISQ